MSRLLVGILVLVGLLIGLMQIGRDLWLRSTAERVSDARPGSVVAESAAGQPTAVAVVDVERVPLASYPQTVARPIFFEDRRLPAKSPPAPPSPAPSVATSAAVVVPPPVAALPRTAPPAPVVKPMANTDGLKLLGVMVTRERARALIEGGARDAEWLQVGSKVRDWSIIAIRSDGVQLRQGSQQATLELHDLPTKNPRP